MVAISARRLACGLVLLPLCLPAAGLAQEQDADALAKALRWRR